MHREVCTHGLEDNAGRLDGAEVSEEMMGPRLPTVGLSRVASFKGFFPGKTRLKYTNLLLGAAVATSAATSGRFICNEYYF